jgi:hypothetical protein
VLTYQQVALAVVDHAVALVAWSHDFLHTGALGPPPTHVAGHIAEQQELLPLVPDGALREHETGGHPLHLRRRIDQLLEHPRFDLNRRVPHLSDAAGASTHPRRMAPVDRAQSLRQALEPNRSTAPAECAIDLAGARSQSPAGISAHFRRRAALCTNRVWRQVSTEQTLKLGAHPPGGFRGQRLERRADIRTHRQTTESQGRFHRRLKPLPG